MDCAVTNAECRASPPALNTPSKETSSLSVDSRLRAAQCRLLYAQSSSALLGALTLVFCIAYVLREHFSAWHLMAWAVVLTGIYGLRYVSGLQYRSLSEKQRDEQAEDWLQFHLLGTVASGLAWGYCGYFLLPDNVTSSAILFMAVGAMSAASMVIYAPGRWSSASFLVSALLPFGLGLLWRGEQPYLTMGIAMLIYLVVLLVSGQRLHAAVTGSMRLAIINEDLAADAERSKTEMEQLNEQLRREVQHHAQAEETLRASEGEFARILENMQDTYYRTDTEGYFRRLSPSVARLLQYQPEELIGRKLADLYVNPNGRERFLATMQSNQGVVHNYEAPLRRKDGTAVWVSTNAHYYLDEQGRIAGVEGTTRDVTDLKRAEEALYETKERAEVTLSSIGDGVITTDTDGRVDYLNPVAEQLTGWTSAEAAGHDLAEVLRLVYEDSDEPVMDLFGGCMRTGNRYSSADSIVLAHRNESCEFSVEVTAAPIRNRAGKEIGMVSVLHDVTELRGLTRKMSFQATHDALTGLINRAEFERRLQEVLTAVNEGSGAEPVLMYLDLDEFKLVNDTGGHVAGDALLRALTQQWQRRVRGNDVLARLGGDEFAVLVEAGPWEKALELAEDLRRITKDFRFQWLGKVHEVGASIGVVSISQYRGSLAEALSDADAACYRAKGLGRNRIHVSAPFVTSAILAAESAEP
jgi:diguanylate cyclase (GGDEF)-like protein/PAS domain S-box-containing protein